MSDLLDSLDAGVRSCGMHKDGDTELFWIEAANDTMAEAAARIRELEAALQDIIDLGGTCGSAKYADAADYIARAALRPDTEGGER